MTNELQVGQEEHRRGVVREIDKPFPVARVARHACPALSPLHRERTPRRMHGASAMGAYGSGLFLGAETSDLILDQHLVLTLPPATRRALCAPGNKPGIKPGRRNEDSRAMSHSADPSAGRVEVWA
jgi:hypothetical protein